MKSLLFIILLIGILLSLVTYKLLENKKDSRVLNYWHYAQSGGFSLDPKDSDSYLNFVLMYQVVGTLLRNGKDGIYEPFLAESWSSSDEGKKYTFKFKSGLTTSKGLPITAKEYSKVFHFLSKYLSSGDGGLVQFDRIVGMISFLKGQSEFISGITVNEADNSISFLFLEPPDDLLIAFTEPYFGFYNLEDLSATGLKNPLNIDSSGYFKITSVSNDLREIRIERKVRDPQSDNKLYNEIILRLFKNDEFQETPNDVIVYGAPDFKVEWEKVYSFTVSDPNMLGALVLSPLLDPFIKQIERERIRDFVHLYKNDFSLNSPRGQISKYFNFLSKPNWNFDDLKNSNSSEIKDSKKKIIDVAYFNLLNIEKNWINQTLEKVSQNFDYQLKLKQVDRSIPGEMAKVNSDQVYKARFVTVVVGGSASNQNNKMMFCSELGVNFKDPSKRICQLVESYEKKSGVLDQAYVDSFNQILWEDAVVIPMMHIGFYWMHDQRVNPKVLKFGMGMPRLDLIEYND